MELGVGQEWPRALTGLGRTQNEIYPNSGATGRTDWIPLCAVACACDPPDALASFSETFSSLLLRRLDDVDVDGVPALVASNSRVSLEGHAPQTSDPQARRAHQPQEIGPSSQQAEGRLP